MNFNYYSKGMKCLYRSCYWAYFKSSISYVTL